MRVNYLIVNMLMFNLIVVVLLIWLYIEHFLIRVIKLWG